MNTSRESRPTPGGPLPRGVHAHLPIYHAAEQTQPAPRHDGNDVGAPLVCALVRPPPSPPPSPHPPVGAGLVPDLAPLTPRGIPTQTWPGINLLALSLPFLGAALIWFTPKRTIAPDD